jgi:hypothetical protein
MISVAEVARTFRVDRETVKSWAHHFKEHLSPGANPGKGIPRRFTPADMQVFSYVQMYWEEDPDIESIRIGLNCGDHAEDVYRAVKTQFTPLFQPPPEDLDETWGWGTLLGGMVGGGSDSYDLAEAFRFAGDTVVDALIDDPDRYQMVYPVLFSYRHAMELYLKAASPPGMQGHTLEPLLDHLRKYLKDEHNASVPRWLEGIVFQFDDFDPKSTTFRYADSDFRSYSTSDTGEFWVDLLHAKELMQWVSEGFDNILVAQGRRIPGVSPPRRTNWR